MATVKATTLSIVAPLEKVHGIALKRAASLLDILTRLRYEGKASLGKNIKAAKFVADYFGTKIVVHMKYEEKTVFNYLKTHVPRLEPVMDLLCEEHNDFRDKLKKFSSTLKKPPHRGGVTDSWKWIDKLTESGTYLVFLLRQHTQAEIKSLYKVINGELREQERVELRGRMYDQCRKEGFSNA